MDRAKRDLSILEHIVAHGYGKLKVEKIWKISHEDTPELQARCLAILKKIDFKDFNN